MEEVLENSDEEGDCLDREAGLEKAPWSSCVFVLVHVGGILVMRT